VKLAVIRIDDVRVEPLTRLLEDIDYGIDEVRLEGFAEHPMVQGSPTAFVDFLRNSQGAAKRRRMDTDGVTRIAFSYFE
jgi:hypothetical protein